MLIKNENSGAALAGIPLPTLSLHFISHPSTVKLLNMLFVYSKEKVIA